MGFKLVNMSFNAMLNWDEIQTCKTNNIDKCDISYYNIQFITSKKKIKRINVCYYLRHWELSGGVHITETIEAMGSYICCRGINEMNSVWHILLALPKYAKADRVFYILECR